MGFFGGSGGGASVADMVGATSSAAGTAGLVPAPASGAQRKFLRGDASFVSISDNALPVTRSARSGYITYMGATQAGGIGNTNNSIDNYPLCGYIYIRETKSYTTFSVRVTSAGAANSLGKIAIYTIGTDGLPSTLVCSSGTFATDSTGLKQPTMTSTVVNSGWYIAIVATNSGTNVAYLGDVLEECRSMFAGVTTGRADGLDYSQKLYANLWPNPWDGTGSTFRNAYYVIVELT